MSARFDYLVAGAKMAGRGPRRTRLQTMLPHSFVHAYAGTSFGMASERLRAADGRLPIQTLCLGVVSGGKNSRSHQLANGRSCMFPGRTLYRPSPFLIVCYDHRPRLKSLAADNYFASRKKKYVVARAAGMLRSSTRMAARKLCQRRISNFWKVDQTGPYYQRGSATRVGQDSSKTPSLPTT
jgi:hypothetical protein